jgi:hypothetical protein
LWSYCADEEDQLEKKARGERLVKKAHVVGATEVVVVVVVGGGVVVVVVVVGGMVVVVVVL